jgi:F0F1-type ATP synthase epsilon subunit
MKLRIIRPHEEEQFSVVWLEVETPVGNFVIHSGHAPTVLTLLPTHDIIFKLKTGEQRSIAVVRGVADITREGATIIISE